MKKLLTLLATAAAVLTFIPTQASADCGGRRFIGYTECGDAIYRVSYIAGYTRCGEPIYRSTTEVVSNRRRECDSREDYRTSWPRPDVRLSFNFGHGHGHRR